MLQLIVFTCGAVVMILEIVGSRVLAPFCGASTVVWTSLIGVILGFLSLGYWLGGRVADARPTARGLSLVILSGSAATALIALAAPLVLPKIEAAFGSGPAAALLSSLLFAPASAALGMVSPYGVRLATTRAEAAGKTAGSLYAVSTLGSIVGTFLAGFVLLAHFGSINLVWILAVILALVSLLGSRGLWPLKILTAAACLAGLALATANQVRQASAGYIDTDTRYSRVLISPSRHKATLRELRLMTTSPRFVQSAMFPDAPAELVLEYTKYYNLALTLAGDVRRVLVLGGAGYSFPKHLLAGRPDVLVDVVELDPGVTRLARQHFALPSDPRLRIFHEDARTFLNQAHESLDAYDVILCDAFGQVYSVPFHLTTAEAVGRIHALLRPGGVAMLNMVSSLSGDTGRFYLAERATYANFFPEILAFALTDPDDPACIQNIVMAAIKPPIRTLPAFEEPYAAHQVRTAPQTARILTDNFAPVDYFMALVELGDRP
jgi:predicted membrane-bound spermidine synthase